jgi:pyrroloquinoline quinone (PQQ) biosynthesis protein C
MLLRKALLSRPLVKRLVEEYVIEVSPMVNNYVKKISQITGLPEDVVKRSAPVRNLVKKIVGD